MVSWDSSRRAVLLLRRLQTTGMQSFKYAFLSVAAGDTENAVATGSERMSKYLTADKFKAEIDKVQEIEENGYIAFEKDFLRWMLSDGAGAALIFRTNQTKMVYR